MDRSGFSDQFRNKKRYKRIGYNSNVLRKYACLAINPITVDNFAAPFNCTPVDRRQTMMARHKAIHFSWLGPELFRLLLGPPGFT